MVVHDIGHLHKLSRDKHSMLLCRTSLVKWLYHVCVRAYVTACMCVHLGSEYLRCLLPSIIILSKVNRLHLWGRGSAVLDEDLRDTAISGSCVP